MRLLLLSGGLDSTLLLHRYGADLCVGFEYGQRHAIELDYAAAIARHYGVEYLKIDLGPLPLVDDLNFAGRNAVLLARAAAICQQRDGGEVLIGCNFSDALRFPDCRPDFIRAMNTALQFGYGVRVRAPLLTVTKEQIVREAREAKLPPTWTCYQPKGGAPCGECYACKGLQC